MRHTRTLLTTVAALLLLLTGYLAGTQHALTPSRAYAADDCRTFTQTGHQACGAFLQYWQDHGGLAQQGYPISDVMSEVSATDGKTYQVQYFERAVFEAHPENSPPYNVLLSLLGSEKYKAKYQQTPPSQATTTPIPATPSTPTSSPAPAGHIGPATEYPNPALTPGDTFPGVTQAQVCVSGYTEGVRNVTSDEKAEVYRRYGVPNESGKHEVDHFIPLELGGSNMLTNLWPEPYEPIPGAHEKDRVENYLHDEVCSGRMTLAQAQEAIRTDWVAVYQRIPMSNKGG